MLALLGTTVGKYIAGGAALMLVLGGVALYVFDLRSQRDTALVSLANSQATVNELQAANNQNLKAIDDLRKANADAQLALAHDALQQQAVVSTVAQIQERVSHVSIPSNACRAADARDLAAVAGVRQLLGASAAGGPGPDGTDRPTAGLDVGHPAAGRP